MKYPDQSIHDAIFRVCQELGYDTYIELPDESARYPFVVMGESQLLPQPTKSFLIGRVFCSVHVWGRLDNRRIISDMLGAIMRETSKIKTLDGRQWSMELTSSSQIIKDNSTVDTLYHGIADITFKFV